MIRPVIAPTTITAWRVRLSGFWRWSQLWRRRRRRVRRRRLGDVSCMSAMQRVLRAFATGSLSANHPSILNNPAVPRRTACAEPAGNRPAGAQCKAPAVSLPQAGGPPAPHRTGGLRMFQPDLLKDKVVLVTGGGTG